jgi:hypothetical protein
LISRNEIQFGKRMVTVYKPTQKGIEFCRSILEPYEKMFPRRKTDQMLRFQQEKLNSVSSNDIPSE